MNWKLQKTGHATPLTNVRNFLPGTVTDRAVRNWLQDPQPGLMQTWIPELLETVVEEFSKGTVILWRHPNDKDDVRKECIEAVTKIEPYLTKFVVPFRYQQDFRFEVPITLQTTRFGRQPIFLVGAMDLLVQDVQDRYWVWDVKHTRDGSYWRKTIGQLYFYDLSTLLLFKKPAHRVGLLQPLCAKEVKAWEPTTQTRMEILSRITSMVEDILSENHPPNTDFSACGWCNTKHACPKYTPIESGGKRRMAF
jgi:hypothetical protein